MKGNDGVIKGLTGFLMVLALTVIGSNQAYAYGGWRGDDCGDRFCRVRHHNHHRHHRHYDHYRPVVVLPGKYITVTIGGERFYRCHGRYYRRHHRGGYLEVSFPSSVIITSIPRNCRKVYIDGRNYYTYNGDYYVAVANGYQLVDRPSGREENVDDDEDVRDIQPQSQANTGDAFTVNIPNAKGGYTAVTLKRSGSGYVGPQGEYYSEFPKVEQLRAMYGK